MSNLSPYVTLNNGVVMPLLGFGTFQPSASQGLGISDETAEEAVFAALKAGYRLIDTAAFYRTEAAVGRAVRRAADELGIMRTDIFITSKLWVSDTSYDGALHAYEKSLKHTGLDYLDLYLIHNPMNDVFGAWRALSKLLKNEEVRAIGVSNFSRARLEDFMSFNEIVPQVNQVEINVLHQQIDDVNYMRDYEILPQAWAPFARGKNDIFYHEVLQEIAKKHKKTVAQVIVRWLLQRGIAVIPKSTTPARISQNYDVWDMELTEDDMHSIGAMDTATSQFFDWTDPAVFRRLANLPYADK
ncbi:aldo/keto reductase [Alloscardovia omnicolens]|uniref:aldo/keto reductase n=1 Tax=Alloscardovia omnicolens TaxID=419015 RepID=UPI003A65DD8D